MPNDVVCIGSAIEFPLNLAVLLVKYGALSNDSGRVLIKSSIEDRPGKRTVGLLWQEGGGPAVEQPRRKGYGTQLIETLLPYELHGEVKLRFEREGLICELLFPL